MSASSIHTITKSSDRKKTVATITLSIVIPFYNEEEVLPEFHRRLISTLDNLPEQSELIYIDDGSTDSSYSLVQQFSSSSSLIRCISLSRNFGKESAMSAGLKHCQGEAVIVIDADLQDPPEFIPNLVIKWREGYDIVNMQRSDRLGESRFKRFSAACFYKLLNHIANLNVPENVGDFRLLNRDVVEHINQLPERNRYMKGLFSWPGYKQTTIQFRRDARYCGDSKWNYLKLIGLAMDGITSFSIRPLRIATIMGALTALSAFIYGLVLVIKTIILGNPISGYPSIMVIQLALGGIQLLCIGLMGEYIGRIFIETKQRPLYLIKSIHEKPAETPSERLENTA